MIPATTAKIQFIISGDMKGNRIKYPANAPTGSANPERNEYQKAFFRLCVAKYTGTDTAIPSGMLCIAIATAMAIPICGESIEAMNVAIPSGKLCIPTTNAVRIPVRINRLRLFPPRPMLSSDLT